MKFLQLVGRPRRVSPFRPLPKGRSIVVAGSRPHANEGEERDEEGAEADNTTRVPRDGRAAHARASPALARTPAASRCEWTPATRQHIIIICVLVLVGGYGRTLALVELFTAVRSAHGWRGQRAAEEGQVEHQQEAGRWHQGRSSHKEHEPQQARTAAEAGAHGAGALR